MMCRTKAKTAKQRGNSDMEAKKKTFAFLLGGDRTHTSHNTWCT